MQSRLASVAPASVMSACLIYNPHNVLDLSPRCIGPAYKSAFHGLCFFRQSLSDR